MHPANSIRRTVVCAAFAAALAVMAGCAARPPVPPAPAEATDRDALVRNRILPAVDHHQHLLGPRAVMAGPPPLGDTVLPAELEQVLRARNRIMETGEAGELYTADAQVMSAYAGRWMRGAAAVASLARTYTPDTQFHANDFVLGDSVAVIAGIVRSGAPPEDELNFQLGLVRSPAGDWRIATEHTSVLPQVAFREPVTADQLITAMDEAGIQRAVVLSVAYWFGSPGDQWPGDEYANVRAENDWIAAEAAKYPGRLVAFCGVSPLREYAVAEIRRCARELGMRGIKLHFSSSRVNLHDADHVAKVREVFRTANELGLAIVAHTRTHRTYGGYGRREAEIVRDELLPAAPDVPIQIAHLWGGAQFSDEALGVFADAVSNGDPRMRNVLFDLTDAERNAGGPAELEVVARRIRQIGVERMLYGTDMLTPDAPRPVIAWARMRDRLPLTDREIADIADNVAPYLR